MKNSITVLLLLIACTLLPACATVQTGGASDSASAATAARHTQVRQALDRLIAAYEGKNSRRFAELVSERYAGEGGVLDTAVRHDFSTYHNLALRYTVNNITLDDSGKAFVAIAFTRSWTDTRTTNTASETGETSLVFIRENGTYKLYSQNRPLLFGIN